MRSGYTIRGGLFKIREAVYIREKRNGYKRREAVIREERSGYKRREVIIKEEKWF